MLRQDIDVASWSAFVLQMWGCAFVAQFLHVRVIFAGWLLQRSEGVLVFVPKGTMILLR